MAEIADVVREGLEYFFGYLGREAGVSPSQLDMTLEFHDGTEVQAQVTPIGQGGTGKIEVEVKHGGGAPG